MTWLNNSKSFGLLARMLHMGIGLVVISLLAVGLLFDDIPSGSPKIWAVSLHKLIGFCILWFVRISLL
jgi:cytochrome b561